MTLKVWIENTGPKEVAKLLKVDPSTVSAWKRRNTLPRAPLMVRIHRLSKGQVTYKEMIEKAARA